MNQIYSKRIRIPVWLEVVAGIIVFFILLNMFNPLAVFIAGPDEKHIGAGVWTTVFLSVAIPLAVILGLHYLASKRRNINAAGVMEEKKLFVQREYRDELLVLPPDYRYYIACEYILSCFVNGRADSMKEAVNLYVEQLDRWKQQGMLNNIQMQLNEVSRQQNASASFFDAAIIYGLMAKQ